MSYQQNALLVAMTWIGFLGLRGNSVIGHIFIINCLSVLQTEMKAYIFQLGRSSESIVELSWIPCHNLGIYDSVHLDHTFVSKAQVFQQPTQRGNLSSYNAHNVHATETKQLLRKNSIIPYNRRGGCGGGVGRGDFSLGIESMTQSKITVGNKKILLFTSGRCKNLSCSLR